MPKTIDFAPYESEIKALSPGEQVNVNHAQCPAGNDVKKRLYLKRTNDGSTVLGYCHHCTSKGALRSKTNRTIKSLSALRKEIAHEVEQDKTWIPPLTPLYDLSTTEDSESYVHLKGWLTQFGLAGAHDYKMANTLRWLQYQPESGRIFLPYFNQLIVGVEETALTDTDYFVPMAMKLRPGALFAEVLRMRSNLWCSQHTDLIAGYQSRLVPNRLTKDGEVKSSNKYLTHRIDKTINDSLITVVHNQPGDEGPIVLNWIVEDLMSQLVLASYCLEDLPWRMQSRKKYFIKVNIWSMMGSNPSTRMINAINASINDHGDTAAPMILTDPDTAGEKAKSEIMKATTIHCPSPPAEFMINEPKRVSPDGHFKLTYHQVGDAIHEYDANQTATG